MTDELLTSRLSLKKLAASDVECLAEILCDKRAMRYTLQIEDASACKVFLERHEKQRDEKGYAPWVIRSRESGEIVGWGGIYDDPFDPIWGPELIYFFGQRAWGKGFATELSLASLEFVKRHLSLKKVCAFAHPENAASIKVLQKGGFGEVRFLRDMNRFLFEASTTDLMDRIS